MRLLDAKTLTFVEYYEPNIPAYAIFSHGWEADEVTFQKVSGRLNQHKAG